MPSYINSSFFSESSAGLNSKLQYQLVMVMFVFAAHISAFGAFYYIVMLVFRVGSLTIFAVTRDKQVDFKALRRDPNGAGLGLVRASDHS
jgi:hypothetical protein